MPPGLLAAHQLAVAEDAAFFQPYQELRRRTQAQNLPNTGGINLHATLLVTKTLLIAGEGWGGSPVFRAYDKRTGDVLSELSIPGIMGSMPMTYMVNGKQYIAFTVGTAAERMFPPGKEGDIREAAPAAHAALRQLAARLASFGGAARMGATCADGGSRASLGQAHH